MMNDPDTCPHASDPAEKPAESQATRLPLAPDATKQPHSAGHSGAAGDARVNTRSDTGTSSGISSGISSRTKARSMVSAAAAAALQLQIREAFRTHLESELGAHRYALWFGNGTLVECLEGGFRVVAANAYVSEWIGRNFTDPMLRAAAAALGEGSTVVVDCAPLPAALSAAGASGHGAHDSNSSARISDDPRAARAGARFDERSPLDSGDDASAQPRHAGPSQQGRRPRNPVNGGSTRSAALRRLEDFVVGDSNRLAHAASVQFGDAAPGAPSILFLHGECGVGKTHLLQGLCRRRQERASRQVIRYVTAEQFTNEYIASVRDNSLEQFRKRLRRVDLLAIDDIHFFANKSATQAEFLHTIDAIDLSGACVALVSDEHPRHIRRFSQALVSRFLSGMVVKVDRPDRQTRSELVRRLAQARGLELTTAAEEAVASRCAGSIREVEGTVTRLGALAELDGVRGPIGPGTVERLLGQDAGAARGSAPVRLGTIVEAVCTRLRVTREDLLGSGRHGRTVVARGVVAHLARELTTHSYPEIARALGRDTHSAVHTAAKRLKSMLDRNDPAADLGEPLREVVDQLRHDLSRASHARGN